MLVGSTFEISLLAFFLGGITGFSTGIWFAKRKLQQNVSALLDFGGDSDDMIVDLSGVVEDLDDSGGDSDR